MEAQEDGKAVYKGAQPLYYHRGSSEAYLVRTHHGEHAD
jgi:hypothetical protein